MSQKDRGSLDKKDVESKRTKEDLLRALETKGDCQSAFLTTFEGGGVSRETRGKIATGGTRHGNGETTREGL